MQATSGQTTIDNSPGKRFNRIDFKPSVYYREYSSANPVSLTINPGDIINTESVDAGGFDKEGQKKSERGNPLTGPFFIEGAEPGDAIAVTITKIALNRNYATTLEALVPRSLPGNTAKKKWRGAKLTRWNIDLENNIAMPANQHKHLQNMKIPLHPFLGCIGVAPEKTKKIPTGDSGPFGGNLDFKFMTETATVYLPVFHSGALLLMGDGHAVQGDGELNGDALETSMSFEFTAQVIKNGGADLAHPRAERQELYYGFWYREEFRQGFTNSYTKLTKLAAKRLPALIYRGNTGDWNFGSICYTENCSDEGRNGSYVAQRNSCIAQKV